jgi:hypothetical protein
LRAESAVKEEATLATGADGEVLTSAEGSKEKAAAVAAEAREKWREARVVSSASSSW